MTYSDLFSLALDELNAANQLQAERDRLQAIASAQMLEELAIALSGDLSN